MTLVVKNILKDFNERVHTSQWKVIWKALDEYGEAHNRTFMIRVTIIKHGNLVLGTYTGTGSSLKDARKCAALNALLCPKFRECCTQNIHMNDNHFEQPGLVKKFLENLVTLRDALIVLQRLTQLLCACNAKVYRLNRGNFQTQMMNSFNACLVLLIFARKQFIGEGCTWSIAEGTAALAGIKALRKAVITVLLKSPANTAYLRGGRRQSSCMEDVDEDPDFVRHLQFPKRIDSPIWRLRTLAALHSEALTLEVSRYSSNEYQLTSVKRFNCCCYIPTLGRSEGTGLSRQMAVNTAAKMLLSTVNTEGNSRDCSNSSKPSEFRIGETTQQSLHKKTRKQPIKVRCQLLHDRCHPCYSECLHPIHRLDCVRSIKGWLPAVYFVKDVKSKLPGSSCTPPTFYCQLEVGPHVVVGPEARSKKLARRLAAECLLKQLLDSDVLSCSFEEGKLTGNYRGDNVEGSCLESYPSSLLTTTSEVEHTRLKCKSQNQVISFGEVREIKVLETFGNSWRLPFRARRKCWQNYERLSFSTNTLSKSLVVNVANRDVEPGVLVNYEKNPIDLQCMKHQRSFSIPLLLTKEKKQSGETDPDVTDMFHCDLSSAHSII